MRVLHIIPDIGISNGVMSIIVNYASALSEKAVFDVLYFLDTETNRKNDIEQLGGKVYKTDFPSVKKPINFSLLRFFKENRKEWDAIHIHGPHFAVFFAPYAKSVGYKKIFVHAHSTVYSLIGNKTINHILSLYSKFFISRRIACSLEAGRFWYGNKRFNIVNNAINTDCFRFNKEIRNRKRTELGIGGSLALGHVGKTDIPQKNHRFLFKVFKEVQSLISDSVLFLIGAVPTDELLDLANELDITDSVFYLGPRNDVAELYQAFDVFLFPSVSEGLPVSVVEAQFSFLPVVMSDSITDEVIISNKVLPVSLEESSHYWAKKVINLANAERLESKLLKNADEWDISVESLKLMNLYLE